MPAITSHMLPLGTVAPDFKIQDTVSGNLIQLQQIRSDIATVIMFICNHCPYVKHVQPELVRLAEDYIPKGVTFVAISSNDVSRYPDDGPEQMKKVAITNKYPFPYLYDETQEVAIAYDAACTPDFYIFDKDMQLVYRGQLDDSRPSNGISLTGQDIRNALDHVLLGEQVSPFQKPSIGCSIKWKPASNSQSPSAAIL
ncbi:thioredoxin family protein [Rhodocytophaga rosea]|uniref:Thioredoxin family protein n=1 Tax=Rhodocytophaga rosea TaxID=2704465 RepID=A0A6C0GLD1_9BACT|nr:thioredoxin family protein [Rhodocytophaga rosea]QHT68624.1 thioredoxin family protein [Rhodocytophaga rosea]